MLGGADDLRRRETDSWESGLDVAEIKGDLLKKKKRL